MRACVIIQLKQDSTLSRVGEDVPEIIKTLQEFSQKHEMVFRSNDGTMFGYFIVTDKPLGLISGTIENSRSFRNGDSILLFEVGEGLHGIGFTRQWTWLQRTATDDQPGPS
jgi:hypothetical protein